MDLPEENAALTQSIRVLPMPQAPERISFHLQFWIEMVLHVENHQSLFYLYRVGVIMSFVVRLNTVVLALFTVGCSTHPLPEDFSRKTTYDIVKRMRCEIYNGISRSSFPDHISLKRVWVGFDFKLTMTEENDASSGKLKFVNPVSGGSFSLDLKASSEKTRVNERTFRVVDSLEKISTEPDCSTEAQRRNFVYPISGNIGLDEMVVTFSKINSLSDHKVSETTTNVFTDKLTFTTILTAGATPELKVEAAQVGSLELTESSIMGSVERSDIHMVTVALAIGDSMPGGSAKAAKRTSTGESLTLSVQNDVPSSVPGNVAPVPDSSAASKVIDELNRQRYRDDLREFPALRVQ